MTADTAQPRKRSNVTRPFPILWVGSGDETMVGVVYVLMREVVHIILYLVSIGIVPSHFVCIYISTTRYCFLSFDFFHQSFHRIHTYRFKGHGKG